MICFLDKTFCTESTCKHFGENCHRSFTEDIKEQAKKCDLPVSRFVGRPDCYEEKEPTELTA